MSLDEKGCCMMCATCGGFDKHYPWCAVGQLNADVAELTEAVAAKDRRIAELEAALGAIEHALRCVEINPSNYTAGEVVALNDAATVAYSIADGTNKQALEAMLAQAKQEAAQECMAIAKEVSESYDKEDGFPSHHAVGAETVAVMIRERLGLGICRMALEVKP